MFISKLILSLAMQAVPATTSLSENGSYKSVCSIPALTEVVLEVSQRVTSKTAQPGDKFVLKLSEPLKLNGRIILPVGTEGIGEVIHSSRPKFGGRGGERV